MKEQSIHKTVLLKEAVELLSLRVDSVVVDCTLGAGGHGREILSHLGKKGVYVGIDADRQAIELLENEFGKADCTVHLVNKNFADLSQVLTDLNLKPTAILADLGWRSDQFESGQKGFSFTKDEPLLMTYGDAEDYTFTAKDIVNEWEESSIADIIYGYGEERYSRRIAKAIIEKRELGEIKSAKELADLVAEAVPKRFGQKGIHPATKTFQALRIAVNDELGVLKTLLHDSFEALEPQGRLAIISFHSLEDRLVKNYFRNLYNNKEAIRITKKPITASPEELAINPRARSAKLRVIEKL